MLVASKRNLMLADVLLVVALVMISATNGLKEYPVILSPLLIIAFASCVVRHINYYKLTKKIY